MEPTKVNKQLVIEERHDKEHKNEKEKLKNEYLKRLRLVLSTELCAKNIIQTLGSLAVPVHSCNFGVVNWRLGELRTLGI